MAWFKDQFLKVIDYQENSNDVIVYRYPVGERQLMKNSKLVVREGQNAIFVHKGQIADLFTPGTYEMKSDNIPVLTSLASWKYLFETPIKTDVYYINMVQFADEKWGTINPIIIRDADFGLVRVRGYGKYSFRVEDPKLFLKELFGTSQEFTRAEITSYLKSILLSALTDSIAESKIPVLDLAANTLEFNQLIKQVIGEKFSQMGLMLVDFFIENISVPEEVEKAMDTRSSMGIMGDSMDDFLKYQAALGIRDAAQNEGGGLAAAGVGMGAGLGLGGVFANAFSGMNGQQGGAQAPQQAPVQNKIPCAKCGTMLDENAKFCFNCGEQTTPQGVVCSKCGQENGANAKFCFNCGNPLGAPTCPKCGHKLAPGAKFCPDCGAQL